MTPRRLTYRRDDLHRSSPDMRKRTACRRCGQRGNLPSALIPPHICWDCRRRDEEQARARYK